RSDALPTLRQDFCRDCGAMPPEQRDPRRVRVPLGMPRNVLRDPFELLFRSSVTSCGLCVSILVFIEIASENTAQLCLKAALGNSNGLQRTAGTVQAAGGDVESFIGNLAQRTRPHGHLFSAVLNFSLIVFRYVVWQVSQKPPEGRLELC